MIAGLKEACGFKRKLELQVYCSVVRCLARASNCPAPKKDQGDEDGLSVERTIFL